jgi:hypothetical protein
LDHARTTTLSFCLSVWIIRGLGWVGIPTVQLCPVFHCGRRCDVAFERFFVCIGCWIQKAERREASRLNNILMKNEE